MDAAIDSRERAAANVNRQSGGNPLIAGKSVLAGKCQVQCLSCAGVRVGVESATQNGERRLWFGNTRPAAESLVAERQTARRRARRRPAAGSLPARRLLPESHATRTPAANNWKRCAQIFRL